jgi:hypothetical protein
VNQRLRVSAVSRPASIYGHLATAIEAGDKIELKQFLNDDEQKRKPAGISKFGFGNLTGVKEPGNKFDGWLAADLSSRGALQIVAALARAWRG